MAVISISEHPGFRAAPPRRREISALSPARLALASAIAVHAIAQARFTRTGGAAAHAEWTASAVVVEARAAGVVGAALPRVLAEFMEGGTSGAFGGRLAAVLAVGEFAVRDGPAETVRTIRAGRDAVATLAGASASDRAWRLAKVRLELDASASLP
jgi:hypothetical protein